MKRHRFSRNAFLTLHWTNGELLLPCDSRRFWTMIIFLNDDRAYLSWVTHHRQGFVLDGKRKPKLSQLVVHRATCGEIKSAASRRIHWTTGGKLKACCLDRAELEAWAAEQAGIAPGPCPMCQPQVETPPNGDGHIHLSKLPREILEYILEAALIHFEVEHPPYRLTLADIAACFGKTPGQILPALNRLLESGMVVVAGHKNMAAAIPPKRIILPTVAAIRTIEAFRGESESTIEGELAKLEPG